MSSQTIELLKIVVVGSVILFGLTYRWRTLGTPAFYRSLSANISVFLAFALGFVFFRHRSLSVDLPSIGIDAWIVLASGPISYLGLRYWKGYPVAFRGNKFILITLLWFFSSLIFDKALGMERSNGSPTVVIDFLIVVVFLSLGILNAVLGPILLSLTVANIITHIFVGGLPFEEMLRTLAENLFPLLPKQLGALAGFLITAMGIMEFGGYFGVAPIIDKITETIQS